MTCSAPANEIAPRHVRSLCFLACRLVQLPQPHRSQHRGDQQHRREPEQIGGLDDGRQRLRNHWPEQRAGAATRRDETVEFFCLATE